MDYGDNRGKKALVVCEATLEDGSVFFAPNITNNLKMFKNVQKSLSLINIMIV